MKQSVPRDDARRRMIGDAWHISMIYAHADKAIISMDVVRNILSGHKQHVARLDADQSAYVERY